MKRWELVTSDEWIKVTTECIVRSGRGVKEMRNELNEFFIKNRDELLHGDQGSGCKDENCKVCYPYRKPNNQ